MLFVFFLVPIVISSTSFAIPFEFSGEDNGGIGSATMDIVISGSTVIATLDNTSPLTLIGSTDPNAPGIVGFGFDLLPSNLFNDFNSATLVAYTNNDQSNTEDLLTFDGDNDSEPDWKLELPDDTIASVTLDYLPLADVGGVKGALYNPDAVAGLSASPNYFTTAILTLNFDIDVEGLVINTDPPQGGNNPSPFVRMLAVGNGGSLRLEGTPGTPVPEPSTMLLLGAGLVGIAAASRKKFLKKS